MAPSVAGTEPGRSDWERFNYDYDSLRLGGLIVAGIFFVLGVLLILSRRCRCKFDQQPKTGEPDEAEGPLRQSMRRLSTRMR